ncbi:MFS transporter [Candidatus Bathyarchaeota archaeon]|nr:MFS transporter [Candidatus Bathyarchaeota archaeon]MBT4321080.1 MFS transporter [Candidatus Bathyarchaeota archaeon]MBT5642192.1 MFS transporter [Candidatus Bathyarchaeota archaeon]MBT6603843.1 MFS transporter [Candidatus Bathyarchaeota archaeon]MBT7186881.1 MFS transporter [Candidatus Bathyarchaeota archaeon]
MDYINKLRDSLSFRGNVPGLFISGIIECSAWHMYDIVWQPYMLSLGGSVPLIGLIMSIWTAFNSLLQLVTGELADSRGRKNSMNYYYFFTITGLVVAIVARNWMYFIVVNIFFGIADSLEGPAFSPMFAESVPPEKMAVAMSMIIMLWSIPGFYAKALGGYLGDRLGGQQVMYIVLAMVVVSALWFYFSTEETLTEKKPFRLSAVLRNIKGFAKPEGRLLPFYLVSILDRFGWQINAGILVTMFTQEYGFSLTEIGILMTVEMVAMTLASIPIGKALDRYSNRNGVMAALVLNVIVFGGYSLTSSYVALIALQLVKGVTVGLWDTSIMLYQNKIVPERERGKTFGNINGIKGLVAIPAPFIGAILFGYIGFKGVFATSAFIVGLALLASTRLVEPKL